MSECRRECSDDNGQKNPKAKLKTNSNPKPNPNPSDKLKITAAADAAATPTSAPASASTSHINVNKCALAAPKAFSYQRASKPSAPHSSDSQIIAETAVGAQKQRKPQQQKQKTPPTAACALRERSSRSQPAKRLRLAQYKAQLRANFFKDIDVHDERVAAQRSDFKCDQSIVKRSAVLPEQRKLEFPNVKALIDVYNKMIVQKQPEQTEQPELKQKTLASSSTNTTNSDEGCTLGLSPCSSDNEDAGAVRQQQRKLKVARCASSDSALGLDVDDAAALLDKPIQRRMTLTVTDLPLRPALLPLAEPTALPDSPLPSPTSAVAQVPSKVLLEERLVGIAQEPRGSISLPAASINLGNGSRRESTQSSISELGGVRYVRTPSVVVSDYSDDITACGISMEEMEYFRLQRARVCRRCSLDASAAGHNHMGTTCMGQQNKDDAQSDISAASSCSNLYYCGSTISALDGGECIINGVRVVLARKISNSSSIDLSGDDIDDVDNDVDADVDDDDEVQQQQRQQEQLSQLLAATKIHAAADVDSVTKKVGSRQRADGGGVTIIGNLNLN